MLLRSFFLLTSILALASPVLLGSADSDSSLKYSYEANGYAFSWDLGADAASLSKSGSAQAIWQGGLLPALWIKSPSGSPRYVKAAALQLETNQAAHTGIVTLEFPTLGTARLKFQAGAGVIRFTDLTATWSGAAPAIISMFYGTSLLTPEQKRQASIPDQPFWPDWQSEGFCVPSAKGGPVQSFFRKWDFGDAVIPLGSFGVTLGTPYAAAYPRPLYSMAMGGPGGWIVFGSGTIPDGAMLLRIQATNGSLEFLYREDLWGAAQDRSRSWPEPLRITWAERAWDGYARLFDSFGPHTASKPSDQKNVWNSWGDFKVGHYDLSELTRKALEFHADVLVLDEGWESSPGKVDLKRFPRFDEDLQSAKAKGLQIGFWQQVLWVQDPAEMGLTKDDLLLGRDGQPIRTAWDPNPRGEGRYCLDPSSPRALKFLRARTQEIVRKYGPALLKLDFGYSSPSPAVAVPRDPALRGERLAFTLLKTCAQAAREIDPGIAIQYYSIHPLFRGIQDVVALDDMGDAGGQEAAGHGEWSIWSALAARNGMAVMASSGYDWNADTEVLLNTAIIGSQGSVLPTKLGDAAVPQRLISKRSALGRWHRRTVGWQPLWLDSVKGDLTAEPQPRSWGRVERGRLTALALRDTAPSNKIDDPQVSVEWKGRWALISQDDLDIAHSTQLACIPFDRGFLRLKVPVAPHEVRAVYQGRQEAYPHWKWESEQLVLEVGEVAEQAAFIGFLVIH